MGFELCRHCEYLLAACGLVDIWNSERLLQAFSISTNKTSLRSVATNKILVFCDHDNLRVHYQRANACSTNLHRSSTCSDVRVFVIHMAMGFHCVLLHSGDQHILVHAIDHSRWLKIRMHTHIYSLNACPDLLAFQSIQRQGTSLY